MICNCHPNFIIDLRMFLDTFKNRELTRFSSIMERISPKLTMKQLGILMDKLSK